MRAIFAIMIKELLQLKRERLTFAMLIGIPIFMLLLFGYIINNDPKNLPAAIINQNPSEFTRSFIAGLESSGYYNILDGDISEDSANSLLQGGRLQFVITIPEDFTAKIFRGESPQILVEADGTDPTTTAPALSALAGIIDSALEKHSELEYKRQPYGVIIHHRYNPERSTRNNVVPGLAGVILTMTLVLMTGLSMTRELERGTMENLLVMPVKPHEVMLGKLAPYVIIGFVQAMLIILISVYHFEVQFLGKTTYLIMVVILFEFSVLEVGLTISSLAKSQLQAMQMTYFFFIPSILLSGFIFPFRGMPFWGQILGSLLPLTYFNRLIRGVMLKGADFQELLPNIYPLLIFTVIMFVVATKVYRKTLD